jgi:hypothetical protein
VNGVWYQCGYHGGHWVYVAAILVATLPPLDIRVSCAQQGPQPAVQPAVPAAKPILEIGDVYLPSSRVYVFVGKTGLGHEHGVAGQLKRGRINLNDPRQPGMLEFDLASFTADAPDARKFVGLSEEKPSSAQQQVTTTMRGADVLDVAKFPTARFDIKQITKLNQPSKRNLPQYEISGDFNLHGVSRPIRVVTEVEDKINWTHLMGSFTMRQSDFGIKPFRKALGTVGVADQLNVWGDLWLAKQRQTVSLQGQVH